MQGGWIRHDQVGIGNQTIFIREAGLKGAPVVPLPHGYPCSSFQFHQLLSRHHTSPLPLSTGTSRAASSSSA